MHSFVFQFHKQSQTQAQTATSRLAEDTALVCRQESKASNSSSNGANFLQSFSPAIESLKVMEDSKTTNKQ